MGCKITITSSHVFLGSYIIIVYISVSNYLDYIHLYGELHILFRRTGESPGKLQEMKKKENHHFEYIGATSIFEFVQISLILLLYCSSNLVCGNHEIFSQIGMTFSFWFRRLEIIYKFGVNIAKPQTNMHLLRCEDNFFSSYLSPWVLEHQASALYQDTTIYCKDIIIKTNRLVMLGVKLKLMKIKLAVIAGPRLGKI